MREAATSDSWFAQMFTRCASYARCKVNQGEPATVYVRQGWRPGPWRTRGEKQFTRRETNGRIFFDARPNTDWASARHEASSHWLAYYSRQVYTGRETCRILSRASDSRRVNPAWRTDASTQFRHNIRYTFMPYWFYIFVYISRHSYRSFDIGFCLCNEFNLT